MLRGEKGFHTIEGQPAPQNQKGPHGPCGPFGLGGEKMEKAGKGDWKIETIMGRC